MNGRLLDLHVVVQGRPLPEYAHGGATWVEGRAGTEYVLRLRNRSGHRVEVVVTVDGLSVVDAAEGSVAGTGYVLSPWQTTDIKGFLRDAHKAAAFLFGGGGDAYRAKLGRDLVHLGVIGAAVFEERAVAPTIVLTYPAPIYPLWYAPTPSPPHWWGCRGTSTGELATPPGEVTCSVSPAGLTHGVSAGAQAQNLGTSYGREVDFSTSQTRFERATEHPTERFEIHYDDVDGLRKRGVEVGVVKPTSPSPFPADVATGCPAPDGWRPA